ncbi:MAG: hypothetical protein AABO58_18670 [Acidobacteriota bacterium]
MAWLLALNGERVLVIDWDLEAPGIHRYFHPFLHDKELLSTEGLLDYVENLAAHSAALSVPEADAAVDLIDYIQPLEWPRDAGINVTWKQFEPRGRIDLLPAGRQGPAYSRKLAMFNWVDFYERLGGRKLLEAAKEQMRSIYDYVLIDSRTGVSDTSGICTAELPDTLVICFTLNRQSIAGASAVADSVYNLRNRPQRSEIDGKSVVVPANLIRILPVPTRVEITSERDKLRVGLEIAQQIFSPYLDVPRESQGKYWGRIQMAYFPFYAFEEIPSVFGDSPNQLLSLSTAIKQLAGAITNGKITDYPALSEDEVEAERIRRIIVGWYLRRSAESSSDAAWLAQDIFDRVPLDAQEPTLSALARLIQISQGTLGPKSASIEDFGRRQAMIVPFVQAKLVTISDSATARTVTFAEPVIVESWKTLRDWIERNRHFLIVRQTLAAAMQSWKLADRDESLLLRGRSLVDAESWADRRRDDFSDEEREFIRLSAKETRKDQKEARELKPTSWVDRLRSPALAYLLAAVLVVMTGGIQLWNISRSDVYARVLGMDRAPTGDRVSAVLNVAVVNESRRFAFIRRASVESPALGLLQTSMDLVDRAKAVIPPESTRTVEFTITPPVRYSKSPPQLLDALRKGRVQIIIEFEVTNLFGRRAIKIQREDTAGSVIWPLIHQNIETSP